jgi:hypothetical protein
LHSFGLTHFPCELQDLVSFEDFPKHTLNSQLVPVCPEEQLQLFGELHVPLIPEQATGSVKPLQIGVSQLDPTDPTQLHTSGDVQVPLREQTELVSLADIAKQREN